MTHLSDMRKRERSQNIYSIFRLLNFLSKAACLNLLQGKKTRGKKETYLRWISSIHNTMNILIILIIFAASLTFLFIFNFYHSLEKIKHIQLLQISFSANTSLISLIVSSRKLQKSIYKIQQNLLEMDDLLKFSQKSYDQNFKTIKISLIVFISTYILLIIIDISFCVSYQVLICSLFNITIDYAIFMHFVTGALYMIIIFLMKERFKLFNDYILSYLIANTNSWKKTYEKLGVLPSKKVPSVALIDLPEFQSKTDGGNFNLNARDEAFPQFQHTRKQKMHFQILRNVHEALCNVSYCINNSFGLQILLFTITLFTEITSNLYYCINYIANIIEMDIEKIINIPLILTWPLAYIAFIFLITWICNLTVNQTNKTIVILQRILLIPEVHPVIAAKVQLFLQQAINRKVRFTAWGFFTMNFKLLGSIVGSVITLLVMLVQFHKIV